MDQAHILDNYAMAAINEAALRPLCDLHLLLKSISSDPDKPWLFAAIASDEDEDEHGETLLRKTLDLSYAQKRGYVNWNHSKEPGDLLGYLTVAEILSPKQIAQYESKLGMPLRKSASAYVEGELYKYVPKAVEVYNILKSMPEGQTQGTLGASLDGVMAKEKESGQIVRAFVRGIAFTPSPAHTETLTALLKSLQAYSNGQTEQEKRMAENEIGVTIHAPKETVAELLKSVSNPPRQLTRDEATLEVMKRFPNITLPAAEKIVDFAVSKNPIR